jgi:hypothetical protein
VKTDFGFHLIEVLEKKPASTRTLEQAQSEIAAQMIAKERSATELAKLEELLRKPTVGDVQKFLDAHNLKWQETGAFSAQAESIPKIGANDDVLHMAFELSESKPLPNRLVHQGPTAYLVRYKPVAAAAIKKPESDANKVDLMASFMANQRAEDALKQWLDSLRKTAKISVNLQMGPSGGGAPPSSDE